ncbi:MAG TPA: ATP-binding protein [Solirubrobacterales bacterium]|nr:ATP-binding protein [Solirubrobacterales bacterium]
MAAPLKSLSLRRFQRWPIRWKLAAVSASLTLVILLVFGGVVGSMAASRIRSDFNRDLEEAASRLVSRTRIVERPLQEPAVYSPDLQAVSLPNGAFARVVNTEGVVLDEAPVQHVHLSPPSPGITTVGSLTVATQPVFGPNSEIVGYIQYARSDGHVDATVAKLWLLIALGILGGTALAVLAGVALAGRAMKPIANLTSTAREIAATRDPSKRLPQPAAEDEVAELSLTLQEMLNALDASQTEREKAMQKQREFVADASHELRTPLTSVLANLELLQASLRGYDQAEDREIVDSALRSSKRMGRLIADLLLLARADAGRLPAHRSVDLAEVAGDAAAEVAPLMGDRELVLDNEKPLRVEGSRDELHRMVLNLLDNAIRHTPRGSCVELRLREDGGDAVVEVADDGPGIPEAMRSQVFDRFVRGTGPADTARGTGTGLGLAIVSAVAESHGGAVEARESKSGGALFVARIPLAKRPKPAAKPLEAL